MSIHPSLSISLKDQKQRSVLKRIERIKLMKEKGSWQEDQPVFGLPKIKAVKIRMKIKKEKVAAEPGAAGAATTEQAPQAPGQAPAKPTAAAKTPATPTAKTQGSAKPSK